MMSLTDAEYDSNFSLAEVDGGPAVIYVSSPVVNVYEITYAYSNAPEPNNAADWSFTPATFASTPGEHYLANWLVDHTGLPAFTFWSSQTEQLCFARATTATPINTDDWAYSPVCDPSVGAPINALVEYQDHPLVVYRGYSTNNLHCAHSVDWHPTSVLSWEQHTVDSEISMTGRITVAETPGGIGVAYRDPSAGTLMYAWFNASLPQGGGDWCVMQVANGVSAYGVSAVAAMANGLPAIAYGDTNDSELRLATMNPPV